MIEIEREKINNFFLNIRQLVSADLMSSLALSGSHKEKDFLFFSNISQAVWSFISLWKIERNRSDGTCFFIFYFILRLSSAPRDDLFTAASS